MLDWCDRYLDRAMVETDADKAFAPTMDLQFALLCSAVAETYAPNTDAVREIDRFDWKLEILQRGMLRAAGR